MARVTEKQEKFLQNLIFKGMSQREAYRDAYQNAKMKDKSVDECASRLMKNIKVISRYKELQAQKEGTEYFDLTLKEEKFVEALVLGASQREAYKNAFNCRNLKEKTIDEKASRLFHTGKIQARYKYLQQQALKAAEKDTIMRGTEILQELSNTARSNILDVLEVKIENDAVGLTLKKDFDPKNIKEMYIDKNGQLRIKMYDRTKAMGMLADIQNVKEETVADKGIKIEIEGKAKEWAQ